MVLSTNNFEYLAKISYLCIQVFFTDRASQQRGPGSTELVHNPTPDSAKTTIYTLAWEPVCQRGLLGQFLPHMNPAALSNVHTNELPRVWTNPPGPKGSLVCHWVLAPQLVPCQPYIHLTPFSQRPHLVNHNHTWSGKLPVKTPMSGKWGGWILFCGVERQSGRGRGGLPASPLRLALMNDTNMPQSFAAYIHSIARSSYKTARKQCFSGPGLMGPTTAVNSWIYGFTLAGREQFPRKTAFYRLLKVLPPPQSFLVLGFQLFSEIAASDLLASN